MRFSLLLLDLLVAASFGYCQTAGASSPTFEVASVKPSDPRATDTGGILGCRGGPGGGDPIRWTCRRERLLALIAEAYRLRSYQLPDGGLSARSRPDVHQSDEFDIDAKVPEGTTVEQFQQMKQNLLKERFKLALHFEKKEVDGCELTVARGGLKMKESRSPSDGAQPPAAPQPQSGGIDQDGYPVLPAHVGLGMAFSHNLARLSGQNVPMEQVVIMVGTRCDGPMSDATGLSGKYDVDLAWQVRAEAPAQPSMSGPPSEPESDPFSLLATALRDQLGLNLQRKKVMVDVAVIDHVEKNPTAN
jgi:uncharacterized protein (TIGR03435 family)